MKTFLLGLGCCTLFATMSVAAETRFESGPQQTALVELYTSEGCSSCPPAEAWMSRLKGDPGLWKKFVPIAFHVDYWDRLGWRDRFSSKEWTERQSRYSSLWGSSSVYTPAVVLNGNELRTWSDASLSAPNDKQAGVLTASTTDGKTFALEFRPAGGSAATGKRTSRCSAPGFLRKLSRRKIADATWEHDFVVLGIRDAAMKSGGGVARAGLTIPRGD